MKSYCLTAIILVILPLQFTTKAQITDFSKIYHSHVGSTQTNTSSIAILQNEKGFYTSGYDLDSTGLFGITIQKFDAEGNFLWRIPIKDSINNYYCSGTNDIVLNNDTTLSFCGTKRDTNQIESIIYGRIDHSGNLLWTESVARSYRLLPRAICSLEDNSNLLLYFKDSSNIVRNYVMKIDSIGNVVWNKPVPPSYTDLTSMTILNNNAFVLAGRQYVLQNLDADPLFVVVDSNINQISSFVDPASPYRDKYLSTKKVSDSTFFVLGSKITATQPSSSGLEDCDMQLRLANLSGDIIWEQFYTGCEHSRLNGCVKIDNNRYLLNGWTICNYNQYSYNIFIIVDQNGNELNRWNVYHDYNQDLHNNLGDIEIDELGNIYGAGGFQSDTEGLKAWIYKSNPNQCLIDSVVNIDRVISNFSDFGADVYINWSSSPPFNDSYIVERFDYSPLHNWHQIAVVHNDTHFIDSSVFIGEKYCYRIRAINNDGVVSCPSGETCIVSGSDVIYDQESIISLYPSPCHDVLNFYINDNYNDIDLNAIQIIGIDGKKLKSNITNDWNKFKLDVSNYESGIYVLRYTKNEFQTASKKFVVIR